jgi:hypothetical protein
MLETNSDGQAFIISAEELYLLKASEIVESLGNSSKKLLKEVSMFDLSILEGKPFVSAGGVYLFFDSNNTCLYVGKATSRSFIERIPAHFDPRSGAWFTHFPNKVVRKGLAPDYFSALNFCAKCSILLLKFNSDINCYEKAAAVERYLRHLLRPTLNSPNPASSGFLERDQTLGEYLQVTGAS